MRSLCVAIPYVQADWDAFLQASSANVHIRTGVLTKSRHGRNVELLQIGQTGPDVKAVLVTGGHHAAETIAGHVLEGLLQEAMSESPGGEAFRKLYVLFAIPFVDKDGVKEGDQGKNRSRTIIIATTAMHPASIAFERYSAVKVCHLSTIATAFGSVSLNHMLGVAHENNFLVQ